MAWKIHVQGASKGVAKAVIADAKIVDPVPDAGDAPPGQGIRDVEARTFEAIRAHLLEMVKGCPDPGHDLRFDVEASGQGQLVLSVRMAIRGVP